MNSADSGVTYRKGHWEIGRPQPAIAELARAGAIQGRVLDVGCGTGEHALLAAGLGLPALGVDRAPTSIETARRKAKERDLAARFEVHDALDLAALPERFDTVIDSGLFHIFSDEDRPRYIESLRNVIPPGGRYFILCFSDHEQRKWVRPRRISREEIESAFAGGWRIDSLDRVTMELANDRHGSAQAWRAAITRV